MIKSVVVVLLVSLAVSNCFEISSKADCTLDRFFTTSEKDDFVHLCKLYKGHKYSVIVGCKNSEGGLVQFGDTYDLMDSEVQGFRFKCVKGDNFLQYKFAGCLMGAPLESVPVGESRVFDTIKCDCTSKGIDCTSLP